MQLDAKLRPWQSKQKCDLRNEDGWTFDTLNPFSLQVNVCILLTRPNMIQSQARRQVSGQFPSRPLTNFTPCTVITEWNETRQEED